MKRILFAAGVALGVALAPSQGQAVFCSNCTQEAGEILREGKRVLEFGKLLAQAKQSVEMELRSWYALTQFQNFRSVTWAMGDLSRRYYPDGVEVANMLRDGHMLMQQGGSIDRLLSRSTMSRLEHAWGGAERWYDAMESRQRIVAVSRRSAAAAIQNATASLAALTNAHEAFAASQNITTISAGIGAMQLQSLNAQHNRTHLEAIRLQIAAEEYNATIEAEERQREDAMRHAESYGGAFARARQAMGR